ncbi:hypothetical protein OKA05_22320 [Luteolibacter arcticus]|uniref:Methyl-accepting transducer domain-containing protein n=1 Tax=Luteolibacter arcticus TaxID=1581411 RepID=A0ABT3GP67_9BACT|nr:hypothetical protein [Luteolibacter arcticus]MCW1925312.1 hypothetical protein [Luteolibacter arcticus]
MSTDESRREIGRRLEAVRSSIRRAQWTRGGLLVTTVMLGGLLLMMALDHLLAPLPQAARWAMFGVWVVGTLAAAVVGLRPLLRKIGLVQVARWIEGRHPEIEERMSTVLELAGGHGGVSESLLEELAKSAGEDVGKVDARAELKAVGAAKKWARPAIALAALLLLVFVVWPKEAARLAVRAVAPFSTLGNAGAVKFSVKPQDVELLEGDALEITASYDGPAKQLELVMAMPGGNEIIQPMLPAGDGWSYRLDPVRESFRYKARAGRGESDGYEVTVWPLPSIPEPRVKLAFPEYTGLLPKEDPLGRGIEAVRGTKVALTGALNTAVEAAWLEIDGKRVADGALEKSASGGRVMVAWDLKEAGSGEAVLMLKHRLGREVEALRFPVRVLEDLSPAVRWLSPVATELRVRPDEVLGLRYEVTEDFGVAALQLEVKTTGQEPRRLARDLPEKLGGGAKPARYRGEGEVAVGELLEAWPQAGELRLRVRAVDARPADLDGPGVGHSEWLLIKIDRNAESLARQELRAEHDGARETIEAAMRQAREARERMDWHRGEMRNEELSKDAVKHFEEARERLAEAQENLEKLAERMQESVHATKADEVRQASEQLAQARQELESAPLQDGQQQREEKLDNAREQAEAAVKNLEKAREAMERDRQKVEELARFQELAQQQRELARQAEKQSTAQQETPMNQEWQDRQRGVEEQLRQQLREQPQARAEVLEAQAEEARKLAEEAKALSESQKGLEEQAKQTPVSSPEGLRESLAKEQAKIAEAAAEQLAEARQQRSEAADQLPEAVAATEQAKDALSKGDDQAAADAAKEAAEALKESVADPKQGEAGQSEQGQPEQGQPEQGQPEQGQSEQGQSEQGQSEQGQSEQGQSEQGQSEQGKSEQGKSEQGKSEQGKSEQGKSEQGKSEQGAAEAEMKAEVEALAERQEKVAEALDALSEGKTAEALQGLQQLQAEEAKQLAEAVAEMPQAEGSGPMNEARETSRQGGEQAQSAAQKSGEGKAQEASGQHQQSAANLQRSADALGRAAEEFDRAAEQAKGQQPEQHRAPLAPQDLAEAFQSASRASEQGQAPQSANQATQAAEAMAKAAQAARQQMQGQGKPGQPMPGQPGEEPGDKPDENLRTPEADPGVPPELAKLGISAADWEKIQANLKSDVGGSGAGGVPEEYRGLVKKYFEAMTSE